MKKYKKLCLGYGIVALSALVFDKLLFYFTGVAFPTSTVTLRRVLIVERGVPYHNFWRDELVVYSVMFFLVATVIALVEEKEQFSSRWDKFCRSKKINSISGIILAFCSFGVFFMWVKRKPDALSVIMLPANALICLLVIARWFTKEIYIFLHRTKKTSQPSDKGVEE